MFVFRWSKIASQFPGRTDNEIKNHWNTRIKKRLRLLGLDPLTHEPLPRETDELHEDCNINPTTATTSSDCIKGCNGENSEGKCDDAKGLIAQGEMKSLLNDFELNCRKQADEEDQGRPTAKSEEVTDNSDCHYHSSSSNGDSNPSIQVYNTQPWFHEVDSILSWDDFDFLDKNMFLFLDKRI